MAPVLRNPPKKQLGRPKKRLPRTCPKCKVTFSSPTKLKNHMNRLKGCGPKAVALQKAKRKEANRYYSKVNSIKRALDKVGYWDFEDGGSDDDAMGDETLRQPTFSR